MIDVLFEDYDCGVIGSALFSYNPLKPGDYPVFTKLLSLKAGDIFLSTILRVFLFANSGLPDGAVIDLAKVPLSI